MEIGLTILKICVCLVLVGSSGQALGTSDPSIMGTHPSTCDHYECPTYKLVETGYGYEIRTYDSAVWISTSPISAPSMTQATKIGYQQLFSYIKGNNTENIKMNMTAPVIIEATPEKSIYTISFYIPKKYQQNPPLADDLHVQTWKPTYVAVRQFDGYVTDNVAKKEAEDLMTSIRRTRWIAPIEVSKEKSPLVAGYSPPFQTTARVNEILVRFNV